MRHGERMVSWTTECRNAFRKTATREPFAGAPLTMGVNRGARPNRAHGWAECAEGWEKLSRVSSRNSEREV